MTEVEKAKIRIELTKPFPDDAISLRLDRKLSSGSFLAVPYLDVRYIVYRLNSLIPGLWTLKTEIHPLQISFGSDHVAAGHTAIVTLTIMDVSMTGTGSSYLVYDEQVDKLRKQDVKLDPKSSETDAIRRAAANHGIGLYLWFVRDPIFVKDQEEIRSRNSPNIKKALENIRLQGKKMYEDTKSYFEKEGKLMFGGING
jgi:hypothetical protein